MPRETLTAVRLRRIAATALVSAGALAAPAIAQEPGLVIDPESPSAKEYALPLENERRLADPGTVPDAGIQQGSRGSPAFGTGVSAAAAAGDGADADADGGGGGSSGGTAQRGGNDAAASVPVRLNPATRRTRPPCAPPPRIPVRPTAAPEPSS